MAFPTSRRFGRRQFLQATGAAGAAWFFAGLEAHDGSAAAGSRRNHANRETLRRILAARPALTDVVPLHTFDPTLTGRVLTHAGPPVTWQRMSGAQRGAVIAAILFEQWADSPAAAEHLASSGQVRFTPNHHHNGVGGMGGVLSPSMLVYVVTDRTSGKRAYSVHEYDAFFGAFDDAALAQVRTWNTQHMPVIGRAVRELGGLELEPIMAEALTMGDELHCRQNAATAVLEGQLAPAIVRTSSDADAAATLQELAAFPHLAFLGLSMAASKASLLAAEGIEGSRVVTTIARNGTEVGIRVSGTGDRWFTARAPKIDTVFFEGFGPRDAGRDLGDSAITESNGLGAFAAAAAPALAAEVGLQVDQLVPLSRKMAKISVGVHDEFPIPQLGSGPPVGIDVARVVTTGITPVIFTAVAHREPGHPIIGLGRSRVPRKCFRQALHALQGQPRLVSRS